MKPRIMYVERKESLSGGDAYYGRVTFSKSGKTIYYRGMTFERVQGYKYNHIERKTGDVYWISGCRKDGADRLYGERVPILIDEDAREEYWTTIRNMPDCVEQRSRF